MWNLKNVTNIGFWKRQKNVRTVRNVTEEMSNISKLKIPSTYPKRFKSFNITNCITKARNRTKFCAISL